MLSVSGTDASRFAFVAYPPVRSKDRNRWFAWIKEHVDIPIVAFEAPHRIVRTLRDCGTILAGRPILVGRELTKAHEEWTLIPNPSSMLPNIREQGEFTLCILPGTRGDLSVPAPKDDEIASLFGRTTASRSRREGLREVAALTGLSTKAVFEALERAKNTIR